MHCLPKPYMAFRSAVEAVSAIRTGTSYHPDFEMPRFPYNAILQYQLIRLHEGNAQLRAPTGCIGQMREGSWKQHFDSKIAGILRHAHVPNLPQAIHASPWAFWKTLEHGWPKDGDYVPLQRLAQDSRLYLINYDQWFQNSVGAGSIQVLTIFCIFAGESAKRTLHLRQTTFTVA